MKLSIGIVGLPNVGKSTLFKALTKLEVNIANYPFATIDPNVGVVAVPDERLDKLVKMSNPKKVIPAVVEFYDIAGLVRGAHKGEGLGNQFLSRIHEVDAIVHLVRCFKSEDISHIENSIDPTRDVEIINTELILKDLETIERRFGKADAEAKTEKKDAKIKTELEAGRFPSGDEVVSDLSLLTIKPQIYLLNGQESDITQELISKIKQLGSTYLVTDLNDAATDLSPLIRTAYKTLGLISFFTTGEDETRAWTIKRGMKAPQAAGVIHTDFEKNFIRAEVIQWDKLLEAGDWAKARQKGWLRIEGKDYVVQDGDVVVVRHG